MISLLLLGMRGILPPHISGLPDPCDDSRARIWFRQWQIDRCMDSFASRLLIRWLQRHLSCSKQVVRLALRHLPH